MNNYQLIVIGIAILLVSPKVVLAQPTAADLIEMDFEDLVNMDVEIQSAGKSSTRAMDLPYAAYIISASEIRQSGVLTVPDALRLAPGVNVSQISSTEWSIGIRGAGGRFSRFVLVMVDGRIAYNSVFSGVNWDELNLAMEHISRIEVIRGPNAAAWGANAVNGIINIITIRPEEITVPQVAAWAGDHNLLGTSATWARPLANDWHLGGEAHLSQWGGLETDVSEVREGDHRNWRAALALGRSATGADTQLTADVFGMTQAPSWSWIDGDLLQVQMLSNNEDKQGWVLQARHQHDFARNGYWRLRASAEQTDRDTDLYDWFSSNYQLDVELAFNLGGHQLSAGINTRFNRSKVERNPIFQLSFSPPERSITNYGIFVSDAFALTDSLKLFAAVRLDDNELSGISMQPSLRVLWSASERDRFWLAASEATTTPSRALVDIRGAPYIIVPASGPEQPVPILVVIDGYQSDQKDTSLVAFEVGYRRTFKLFSVDLALFDFDYNNEVDVNLVGDYRLVLDDDNIPSHLIQPAAFVNSRTFASHGGEITLRGQWLDVWSSQLSYSIVVDKDRASLSNSTVVLTNQIRLSEKINLSLNFRGSVGSIDSAARYPEMGSSYGEIDDYLVADLNMNWLINSHWQVDMTARNIGVQHNEAIRERFATEILRIEPTVMLKLRYRY